MIHSTRQGLVDCASAPVSSLQPSPWSSPLPLPERPAKDPSGSAAPTAPARAAATWAGRSRSRRWHAGQPDNPPIGGATTRLVVLPRRRDARSVLRLRPVEPGPERLPGLASSGMGHSFPARLPPVLGCQPRALSRNRSTCGRTRSLRHPAAMWSRPGSDRNSAPRISAALCRAGSWIGSAVPA